MLSGTSTIPMYTEPCHGTGSMPIIVGSLPAIFYLCSKSLWKLLAVNLKRNVTRGALCFAIYNLDFTKSC